MNRYLLTCVEPGKVELTCEPLVGPANGEVLVKNSLSGISPGTEMLVYQGQWPDGMAVDSTIDALAGSFSYPISYGYCAVGKVVELGPGVGEEWRERRVFSFQPHQSHFAAAPHTLIPIPDDIDDETALFFPGMETAVTLLLDGRPLLGEKVIVLGQGIIGLLTTALLSRFPLATLSTVDKHPLRRQFSKKLGAHGCYDPDDPATPGQLAADTAQGGDADLVFELSGNPACLNDALALVRQSGRIVVGSWYGAKKSALDLGAFFHRGRVSIISSQVSSLPPDLTTRWQKSRRVQTVWEMLRRHCPRELITHRFPPTAAAEAYALIARDPGITMQVLFDYGETSS